MMLRLKTLKRSWSTGRSWSWSWRDDEDVPREETYLLRSGKRYEEGEEEDEEREGLVRHMFSTGAWRVLPLLLLTGVGYSILLPELPSMCTNYFAKRDCSAAPMAEGCDDAHWRCLSDQVGRKLFLVLGTFISALPAVGFTFIAFDLADFSFCFPLISFGVALGSFNAILAYVSDCVQPRYRTEAISILLGEMLFGVIVGPHLSRLGTARTHGVVACVIFSLALVWSMFVPESLTREKRARKLRIAEPGSLKCVLSLFRSSTFLILASIACIGSMTSEGSQEIAAQFLQLVNGWSTGDQANLIEMIGVSGIVVQFALIPFLLSVVKKNESMIIVVTNLCLAALNVAICFCSGRSKWLALILQSLTFIGLVPFTISAGILSKAVSARHQGMVAGVIGGVRAQAYGLGPVIYASIFRVFTQTGSNLPYLPGASYLFSAVMMALCSLLALFLDSAGRIVVASDDDL
ncbi:MFS general substrate transporter [Chloropicon primus]|uniref:MFS general substrate transporter n=1 Tax=Chloropicon primus TaxID=1764295 RepID=A0A5B8MMX5_9CHLO|nr:MFS general substrate transporter [Chloropicon primus]UPR00176.1 MFS general substrate transporter [Chloropicon primus]|eukprot:QDZ20965.1 MFS general substrate transporter [Chloropicon primus]